MRAAGWLGLITASVCTCPTTVVALAEAFSAACACGATATSAPAIATAGAALVAFSATFSTCDGVVCLPVRRNFFGRRCNWTESTELPK